MTAPIAVKENAPLVLLTGGNGHIGFRVLVFLLRAGYRVRAALRNQSRADLILISKSIKQLSLPPHALSFIFVPDLLLDGAYDDAVQNVEYAVHIGGPIAHGNEDLATLQEGMIDPSIKGTMNMLFACEKSSSVRRVILTSSVVGMMTWSEWFLEASGKTFTETSRVLEPERLVKEPFTVAWEAYSNAKVVSLNQTEEWVRERKNNGTLHFDVVNVHPSIVIGPHELAQTKEDIIAGVNFLAIMPIMGQVSPFPVAGATVHIDDCAQVFLRALDTQKVKTGADGLLSVIAHSESPGGTVWNDGLKVVRETWPELVEKGLLPCTGSQPTKETLIDARRTEELLGIKFQGYEAQIRGLFEQWNAFVERDGAAIAHRAL